MEQPLNFYRCTPRQIRKNIIRCIKAGVVPMIRSSPGMGKSSIARGIGHEFNLKPIDHRMSTSTPEDMTGLPRFTEDGFAYFAPFTEMFPLESMPLPTRPTKVTTVNGKTVHTPGEAYDGWLLLLDEFNSGSKAVQAAAYKLILDRMVGQHKLHPNVVIICAGNLSTDNAIVNNIGTAMQSRLAHLEMEISFNEWLQDVALVERYDQRIIAFLSYRSGRLMDFRPDHQENTFCCPRTWEFVNRLIKDESELTNELIPLLKGTITSGVAAEFVQYTKCFTQMIPITEILKDPENCRVVNDDVGLMWAVVTNMMEKATLTNFADLGKYADRLDMGMRMLFYRGALTMQPDLRKSDGFARAMTALSNYIHG